MTGVWANDEEGASKTMDAETHKALILPFKMSNHRQPAFPLEAHLDDVADVAGVADGADGADEIGGYEANVPRPPGPPPAAPPAAHGHPYDSYDSYGSYDSAKLEPPGFTMAAGTSQPQAMPAPAFHYPVAFAYSTPGSQHSTSDPDAQSVSAAATPPSHGAWPNYEIYHQSHGPGHFGGYARPAEQGLNPESFGAESGSAGSSTSAPAGWLHQPPHQPIAAPPDLPGLPGHSSQPGQPGAPAEGPGPAPGFQQAHFHAVPHPEHDDLAFRHPRYAPKRTLSVPSDQATPYMTDLNLLLSPDQPDEGVRRLETAVDASRRSSQTSADREDTSPPKRRANTQLSDDQDGDGRSKRIRGRPRVDPVDQTQADVSMAVAEGRSPALRHWSSRSTAPGRWPCRHAATPPCRCFAVH
jgi:hypothetical protein